jgi:tRNA/rRNA methyltransferase
MLDAIRIILVEPAGALNVGSVARVMKNMGLQHLVLVHPHCDPVGAEARQMAVHAAEILEAARIVPSLSMALRGCTRAIATTGRPLSPQFPLEHPRLTLPWLLTAPITPDSAALIFGPEDRGLNKEELNYAHRCIYIPANPVYPSLNLAQAVAICCYELAQAIAPLPAPLTSPPKTEMLTSETTAPLDQVEGFYQQLEALLLQIGYLYPHTAVSRMHKFRRLFNRALPSSEEVAMLRGVLSQVKWAIGQGRKEE